MVEEGTSLLVMNMEWRAFLSLFLIITTGMMRVVDSVGEDVIAAGEWVRTNQTVTSISQTFALGFFDSGNATHRRFHLGIWYNLIPGRTVVWVANRNVALADPGGGATIADDGNLVIVDASSTVIWSTGVRTGGATSTAVLEESGNLVLRDGEGRSLWESFDFPSDTYLPGMKIRLNVTTGEVMGLVSWKAPGDPSPGEYYVGLDPVWPAQIITSKGAAKVWRTTWWNNRIFSEMMTTNGLRAYAMYLTVVTVADEMALTISVSDSSLIWRFQLNRSGILEQRTWLPEAGVWDLVWNRPRIPCHLYSHCGPNGVCNRNRLPECGCLIGTQPTRLAEWNDGNWSAGCERPGGVQCGEGDGFWRLGPIKLPDLPISKLNLSGGECAEQCLMNCSCGAYSYANISFGPSPRCLHWTGRLLDLEENYTGSGQDLYIRLSKHELDRLRTSSKKNRHVVAIIASSVSASLVVLSALAYLLWIKLRSRDKGISLLSFDITLAGDDLPLFTFSSIQSATENFSMANKLGEGGFGPVYKGNLSREREIAVKRLSLTSGQGFKEFKNEVELIAKLQHRNLVRLLGWCLHKDEKLLIYEFMPNKSLDKFLFDPTLQSQLDWGKRFHIVVGIAQGLLYLHKLSRLTIIHRDLKTSNILLDAAMNPKISDFGLARIVGGNQPEGSTERVVGTYGYMSPEYALDGHFSEKSDVFSFGVILLELVSGKRSTGFYPFRHSLNLLGYAWLLWREDKFLELMDPSISQSYVTHEVARCIHIALLCVQEDAADRPNMSSVILMLNSENPSLPYPKEPAFSVGRGPSSSNSSSSKSNSFLYFSMNTSNQTQGST